MNTSKSLDDVEFYDVSDSRHFTLADDPKAKQQIKDILLEIVDDTAFAYPNGLAYAKVVRKKVEEL